MSHTGGHIMSKAYHQLFIGFILILLDIHIGPVDILPDMIGYMVIYQGVKALWGDTQNNSYKQASYYCIGLSVISLGFFMVRAAQVPISEDVTYILTSVGTLMSLLLIINVYIGAKAHVSEINEELAARLSNSCKWFTIIETACLIAIVFGRNIPLDQWGTVMVVVAVVSFIVYLVLVVNLYKVYKFFQTGEEVLVEEIQEI